MSQPSSSPNPSPSPSRRSFPIVPPDGESAEGWLSRYDSDPAILPDWPESKRLAVVCVEEFEDNAKERHTHGFVITAPDYLATVVDPGVSPFRRLFFRVPRKSLLENPDVCPGLTADSWST